MVDVITTPGLCDPADVSHGERIWSDAGSDYKLLNCTCKLPPEVPLKTALKGAIVAPWVKATWYDFTWSGDCGVQVPLFTITTGNISEPKGHYYQPPGTDIPDPSELNVQCRDSLDGIIESCACRAAIKSFQYSWGAIDAGSTCKLTIVDEHGGSFKTFVDRLYRNAEGASVPDTGVYKLAITWGWIMVSGEPCAGTQEKTIIKSLTVWFLPRMVTMTNQGNKWVYEVEGVDLIQASEDHRMMLAYGKDSQKVTFAEASTATGLESKPPFRVEFYHIEQGISVQGIEFYLPNAQGGQQSGGPESVYRSQEFAPLDSIKQWMHEVAAQAVNEQGEPVGLTFNFDATYDAYEEEGGVYCRTGREEQSMPIKGRLLVWTDAKPTCQSKTQDFFSRIKAAYIVNGGNSSPVIGFTPNVKYNFTAAARAGGFHEIATGANVKMSNDDVNPTPLFPSRQCEVSGTGPRLQPQTTPEGTEAHTPERVGFMTAQAMANNLRANLLTHSVEAELRVQGDPSDFLCSPIFGYGRYLALTVVTPFFVDEIDEDLGCPQWTTVSQSICNPVLTSRTWFIRGVDHQIKEGSYITTYKLILFAPGGDVKMKQEDTVNDLVQYGLDPGSPMSVRSDTVSTIACPGTIPVGSRSVAERVAGITATECEPGDAINDDC